MFDLVGGSVCDQQLSSSSTCFWITDSAPAALAGQQQSARQLLQYLNGVAYAYGACAGADMTDYQGGRRGHLPAAEVIRQGVYRIQRSSCTKPTATAAAEAASMYVTADDVTRTMTMAANQQLSNGSGSSSSEVQDRVQLPRSTVC
jgi:hypothetical protein